MNKKLLLSLSFAAIATLSYAQVPTLTGATSNPVIGDAFVSVNCDTTGVVPMSGGANIIWDFTGLSLSMVLPPYDTGTVVIPSTTPAGFAYSSATYAIKAPTATVVNYYMASPSKLSQDGVYIDIDNNTVYSNPMDQLHYPFTYLDTFTDAYAGLLSYLPAGGPVIHATEAGSVFVQADGYGTLKLPGTPSATIYTGVLRVHSSQSFRDSANLFGTPLVGTYQIESYTWYQPYYHGALLTISTAVGPGVNTKLVSYAYKQIANHDNVPSVNMIDATVKVYPNPAHGLLNITFSNATNENVRISLLDVLGRETAQIANQPFNGNANVSFNTSSVPKGLYLVRIQSGTETVMRKVEIQ